MNMLLLDDDITGIESLAGRGDRNYCRRLAVRIQNMVLMPGFLLLYQPNHWLAIES